MSRVLVTGAGGPAGVAVIRSLLNRPGVEVFAADMDGWASGLYLVPVRQRRIVEPGSSPGFVDAILGIIVADRIDVVFSTVDAELIPLARRRSELEPAVLAAPSLQTIELCLDKFALAGCCTAVLRVPTTQLLTAEGVARRWNFPVIVKPRTGAGSRGVRTVIDRAALEALGDDASLIIQELLPGDEYSVDVIAGPDGAIIAAVPRTRSRVDSGVSIAGRTVHSPELEHTAAQVALAIGLVGVANVQLRYDSDGIPALLEVNPRFPGAMPLTIAAGVDMPCLALDMALGVSVPTLVEFRDIANVRYLDDLFFDPAELLISEHAAHVAGE